MGSLPAGDWAMIVPSAETTWARVPPESLVSMNGRLSVVRAAWRRVSSVEETSACRATMKADPAASSTAMATATAEAMAIRVRNVTAL